MGYFPGTRRHYSQFGMSVWFYCVIAGVCFPRTVSGQFICLGFLVILNVGVFKDNLLHSVIDKKCLSLL